MTEYTKGLHQVADRIWAWLAPDGSWGWSNAGIVGGDGASFLVDTLFDLPLTAEMLAAMSEITDRSPITDVLNTHANGDHCYGNQLLAPEVKIHATASCRHEMHDVPPAMLHQLTTSDLGPELTPYVRRMFGAFDFSGITLRDPDVGFEDDTTVTVGGRDVRLVPLGPAHTGGDAVAYVPDAGVVFAGGLLFIGGTPVTWSGDLNRWIAACDTMASWAPAVVVPGHGPVTDVAGILEVRGYLTHVRDRLDASIKAGHSWREAAGRIDLGPYTDLPDPERIVITAYNVYRRHGLDRDEASVMDLVVQMAAWLRGRGAATS
jgi:glyoxylase-like metal-dependent hydrolase (beta-lactamase superfamily II)